MFVYSSTAAAAPHRLFATVPGPWRFISVYQKGLSRYKRGGTRPPRYTLRGCKRPALQEKRSGNFAFFLSPSSVFSHRRLLSFLTVSAVATYNEPREDILPMKYTRGNFLRGALRKDWVRVPNRSQEADKKQQEEKFANLCFTTCRLVVGMNVFRFLSFR